MSPSLVLTDAISLLLLMWLPGTLAQTLSAPDLRDQEISALIARKLREFHELDMPGPKDVSLWQRLRYEVAEW
jgi:aminoglycoside phosphotransferase